MTKDQLEAIQMLIADTLRVHGIFFVAGHNMKVRDGLRDGGPIMLTFENSTGTQFRLAIEVKEAPCLRCDGDGWYVDSESDHAPICDCDTKMTTCPIEVQVQVECSACGGIGILPAAL